MDVKNKGILVDAVARLALGGVDVELLLLGDGPLRADIERRVAMAHLADRVRVAGFVPDLFRNSARQDAYALPSHSEGCSLSLVEAMAMGVPAIASRIPGNEEVLNGLDPSWLVPPTDVDAWARAIKTMSDLSPRGRAELGRAARERASLRFTPKAYVSALEPLYERVYAGGR